MFAVSGRAGQFNAQKLQLRDVPICMKFPNQTLHFTWRVGLGDDNLEEIGDINYPCRVGRRKRSIPEDFAVAALREAPRHSILEAMECLGRISTSS
jgi:hypothetical protein